MEEIPIHFLPRFGINHSFLMLLCLRYCLTSVQLMLYLHLLGIVLEHVGDVAAKSCVECASPAVQGPYLPQLIIIVAQRFRGHFLLVLICRQKVNE